MNENKTHADNKYIDELVDLLKGTDSDKRNQIIIETANYAMDPDLHIEVSSGVKELDEFLFNYNTLNELSVKISNEKNTVQAEDFIELMPFLLNNNKTIGAKNLNGKQLESIARVFESTRANDFNPIIIREKEEEMKYSQLTKHLIKEIRKELFDNLSPVEWEEKNNAPNSKYSDYKEIHNHLVSSFVMVNHLCTLFDDIEQEISKTDASIDNKLILLYQRNKPQEKEDKINYLMKVSNAVANFGSDTNFGNAHCPVKSFKKATIINDSITPCDYETVEFVHYLINLLEGRNEKGLIKELSETYDEFLPILTFGKDAFKRYENFTEDNCPGCVTGSNECDFMEEYKPEVINGKYAGMKCPGRMGGTFGMRESGKVEEIDLSNPFRIDTKQTN